jgi:PLP dependent protein
MILKSQSMPITDHLSQVRSSIPSNVKLIAVSKTYPAELIAQAYHAGQRAFGENRVQELVDKQAQLPADIEWHLIGHLQKNKVKYIAPFVAMIHAIDQLELLEVVNKEAEKSGRIIRCLIQIHIAQEASKFGFSYQDAYDFFGQGLFKNLKNVEIAGLMGMATFTENLNQVRDEFRQLASFFKALQQGSMSDQPSFRELSMGMSGDYLIAIEEGATMVRVGSAIFGSRH